jgi:hypothetical protein
VKLFIEQGNRLRLLRAEKGCCVKFKSKPQVYHDAGEQHKMNGPPLQLWCRHAFSLPREATDAIGGYSGGFDGCERSSIENRLNGMGLPVYIFAENRFMELVESVQPSLNVVAVDETHPTKEGIEQIWACRDSAGDLFLFTTEKLAEQNGFSLPADTFCIITGPTPRRGKKAAKQFYAAVEEFGGKLWLGP